MLAVADGAFTEAGAEPSLGAGGIRAWGGTALYSGAWGAPRRPVLLRRLGRPG